MPLPIEKTPVREHAKLVLQQLKVLGRDAHHAKDLSNANLMRLYASALKSAQMFSAMTEGGLTAEVVGPLLGDIMEIDWQEHESEFLELKNKALPDFILFFQSNEAEILQRRFVNGREDYQRISQVTRQSASEVVGALAALFDGV